MPDDLAALRRTIETLPREVTAKLRSVAWQSSRRVKDRALSILQSKTGKADRIAVITIVEDAEAKQFRVIAEGPSNKPANLALWFERGTRFMVARPFMRPAGDAEDARYKAESLAAAQSVIEQLR
jgi:hypothetical protein